MIKKQLQNTLKAFNLELEFYENSVSDIGCRCIKFKIKDQYIPEMQIEYWVKHKNNVINQLIMEVSDTAKIVAKKLMNNGANRDIVDYYSDLSLNVKNYLI